ncbi:MAG TPA: M28 family peptidase [Bryobacteraceae bacterium]|nr:M28 family peptidase [Bryobacteraceae bacterium]
MKLGRRLLTILVCAVACAQVPAPEQAAIDRISADSLRKNLSYLASDELEGRGTPSRGLDLAAEYIAKQFRDAGLESATPDGSYFQPAMFEDATVNMTGFRLTLKSRGDEMTIVADETRVRSFEGLDLESAAVLKLPENGAMPPVAGKIVAGDERRYGAEIALNELQARKPSLILLLGRTRNTRRKTPAAEPPQPLLDEADGNHAPVIRIRHTEAGTLLHASGEMTVSLHLAKPVVHEVRLRNVAAILRGSDAKLRNQYMLITAHYDHLGRSAQGIFHGANDNGSGTVSVIEIAKALAALETHPKRSIVFVTLFGEEEGLLGSYYYAHHPLFPLKNAVVNINLEQMGRTDDPAGKQVGEFGLTGPSYSNVSAILSQAARAEGVGVYTRKDADDYFDRSDNYSFAQFGVISHTVVVAFDYPDYHGLGDKWEKIDFANMAKVDRGVAAGILRIADAAEVPRWSNAPGVAIYRNAGH